MRARSFFFCAQRLFVRPPFPSAAICARGNGRPLGIRTPGFFVRLVTFLCSVDFYRFPILFRTNKTVSHSSRAVCTLCGSRNRKNQISKMANHHECPIINFVHYHLIFDLQIQIQFTFDQSPRSRHD